MSKIKIGVISDVHSNYYAFKAVYDYMKSQEINEYLLLGDYVSDTSEAEKTMELLYKIIDENKVHILRGNREEYCLDQRKALKEKMMNLYGLLIQLVEVFYIHMKD